MFVDNTKAAWGIGTAPARYNHYVEVPMMQKCCYDSCKPHRFHSMTYPYSFYITIVNNNQVNEQQTTLRPDIAVIVSPSAS